VRIRHASRRRHHGGARPQRRDEGDEGRPLVIAAPVVVIGAGLNGLVAAATLALRKVPVVLLDQRPVVGGAAITTEFVPGFRAPTLSHSLGPVAREVIRTLRLDRTDLEFLTPDPALTTLASDGRAIVFHRDPVLTAASISGVSTDDAGRWSEFLSTAQRLGRLLGALASQPPPSIDEISAHEWWKLFMLGRQARALGRRDLTRLVRWMPMAVADLTGEWFQDELVQGAIAAHAIFGHAAGPWSAGTGGMLLQRLGSDPMPVGSGATVRGGPGALSDLVGRIATHAGAQVRTAARVVRITTKDGRVGSVVLENGEEIRAHAVIAAVNPKHALLHLVEPAVLPPSFTERMSHYRTRGVTAKINFALDRLPTFPALSVDSVPLRGRLLIAPSLEYLERAFDATKYGQMSAAPWLEIAVPSVIDPSLAPEGKHVMSVYVHFTPRHLRATTWSDQRENLVRAVMGIVNEHAPGLAELIVGRQVLTPEDLEQRWELTGGHVFHGEHALDQSWMARPLLGWAQYGTPVPGLYLGSAGVHPGGGLTGLPGLLAARRVAQDLRRRQ